MKFTIVAEVSEDVANKSPLIGSLAHGLAEYFMDKDYGGDVQSIIVRLIAVSPEFEWFSTVRKPRYTFYKKYSVDGREVIDDRLFSFSTKVDHERYKNQSQGQNERMLASVVLQSLSNLDSMPKKVKAFDKERFKKDMRTFLSLKQLLPNENDE